MKKVIHRAESRGCVDHGWLKTKHTFSFAGYYNPERMNFGMLRVLNDDIVMPEMGFGTHPHDNMEIISIPISGALRHVDSMKNVEVIEENDIQVMSAGSRITHSEFNHSSTENINFLQLWFFPGQRNVVPRFEIKKFPPSLFRNRLTAFITPEQNTDTLWLHQNTWLYKGEFDMDSDFIYTMKHSGNGTYFFIISGEAEIEGERMNTRDGMGIWEKPECFIKVKKGTVLLVIEVPM